MKWNSTKTSYTSKGKKVFVKGDKVPVAVITAMGKETVKEYLDRGLLVAETTTLDAQRIELMDKAKGLSPHHKAGVEKLKGMLEDHASMEALKEEALGLGIEPSKDVKFAELKKLVDGKKDESD